MRSQNTLDYESQKDLHADQRPAWVTICAISMLITSVIPVWCTYASIGLLPGCVGSLLVLIGLRPLWKMRHWGAYFVLIGSALLFLNLAFFVSGLAGVMWHYSKVFHFDLADVLTLVAFVFDIGTMVLLIPRLRKP